MPYEFSSPYEELLYISVVDAVYAGIGLVALVFVPLRGITLYIRMQNMPKLIRKAGCFRPLTRNYSIYREYFL